MGNHLFNPMRNIGVVVFVMLSSCTTPEVFFENLEGCWCGPSSGEAENCETWKRTANGFEGKGEWIEDGDRVVTEKLNVLHTDSGDYYVAHPIGAKYPTSFKIEEMSESQMKAVNRRHDFPQVIQYRLSNDTVFIRLEGVDMNEEPTVEEYFFVKQS
jgi:hypothetical protein